MTILTDNGGPFRSARSTAFIAARPELHHVRTRHIDVHLGHADRETPNF